MKLMLSHPDGDRETSLEECLRFCRQFGAPLHVWNQKDYDHLLGLSLIEGAQLPEVQIATLNNWSVKLYFRE